MGEKYTKQPSSKDFVRGFRLCMELILVQRAWYED